MHCTMASITIRNLDEDVMAGLRLRAAVSGHSMEEEAKAILGQAVSQDHEPKNLAQFIHECFAPLGGVDLSLPPRDLPREPPNFR